MPVNKIIILSFCILAFSFLGNAQTSCVQNLRDARNAYDEGRLKTLSNLLSNCVEDGFTKEEKVEALRLITLSHLFNEDQAEAEKSYLKLLKINPEFTPNEESDPIELIILAENFDAEPKFFFGFKGGASYNIMQIQYESNHNLLLPGTYDFPLGISGGLFFQYPITKEISANLEAIYNFRNTILNRPIESAEGNNFQIIEETQQWLEMPILVNYKLPWVKKFLLEATAGPSFHYLLMSGVNLNGLGEELNNYDMLSFRNQFNMSGILGLRANFKELGVNFITTELLFQYRILDEVNKSAMTEQQRLELNSVAYSNFDYKGHAIWLRLGIRFPYFKPELKK
ncbi:outer membrane beta-barrel protein [Marivirga arenosa]|uniref:Outer membrane beta-barrel protein n=1 Tax=Marivirga arenosa TaxID=3059076 RepID=A0AA51ZWJ4_9BACT|nr:outer membrane beta-barrel protein [Marivirga sp. BKB1-2]WNB18064.1 outer membrane beta-barrel protein [Marivirga sp. BKB1-2]